MIISIVFNFSIAKYVYNNKKILWIAVSINILIIGYFKYAFFIIDNINHFLPFELDVEKKELPLGISFFTFQQIAYLVDTYYGGIIEKKLFRYSLLVSFFPHSIAGPLVQYKEIAKQFERLNLSSSNFLIGMLIFIIGLFKKIVIADSLAPCVDIVFDSCLKGDFSPSFAESWFGSICYTFQLYFDFSGYSDMALGLAKMFNINFPVNFNSPYKSKSIIEFWRRWHITLSMFLRNYVYIPLGGNRCNIARQYSNIFYTMLLGGLWHGANWTFILWGALHGIFLIVNHLYRDIKKKFNITHTKSKVILAITNIFTFLLIVISWVIFRAQDLRSALNMYKSMFMLNCPSFPVALSKYLPSWLPIKYNGLFDNNIFSYKDYLLFLILAFVVCFFFSNTNQFFNLENNDLNFNKNNEEIKSPQNIKSKGYSIFFKFEQSYFYSVVFSILLWVTLLFMLFHKQNVFLYFNF